MSEIHPAPVEISNLVNQYVESELADAAKYSNRSPLDESGVYSLHTLAREIYHEGWKDGLHYNAEQERGARRQEKAREAGDPS